MKSSQMPPMGTAMSIELVLPSQTLIILNGPVNGHIKAGDLGGRGPGITVDLKDLPAETLWLLETALDAAEAISADSKPIITGTAERDVLAEQNRKTAPELEENPDLNQAETELIAALSEEVAAMRKLNPFQILNVGYGSDDVTIRQSFGELTRRYHPDRFVRFPGAEAKDMASEVFILIRNAYQQLSNPSTRGAILRKLGRDAAGRPLPQSPKLGESGDAPALPPPPKRQPTAQTPGLAPGKERLSSNEKPMPVTEAVSDDDSAPTKMPELAAKIPAPSPALAKPKTNVPPPAPIAAKGPPPMPVPPPLPISGAPAKQLRPTTNMAELDKAKAPAPPPIPVKARAQTAPAAQDLNRLFDTGTGPKDQAIPLEFEDVASLGHKANPVQSSFSGVYELLDRGEYERAITICNLALKRNPGDTHAKAHIELANGMKAMASRNRMEAAQHFETVLELDPTNERAARELAEMRRSATAERKGLLSRLLAKE